LGGRFFRGFPLSYSLWVNSLVLLSWFFDRFFSFLFLYDGRKKKQKKKLRDVFVFWFSLLPAVRVQWTLSFARCISLLSCSLLCATAITNREVKEHKFHIFFLFFVGF
jgi:hypothetical protein